MRTFIEYDPEMFVKVDGVCLGNWIKSQLNSTRIPGTGPDLPPNMIEVTDREQEDLGADGWVEFAYDPETDTFTKFDIEAIWPETADGEGGNP